MQIMREILIIHVALNIYNFPSIDIFTIRSIILSEFYQRRGESTGISQDAGRIRNFIYWRYPWSDWGSRGV